MIVVVDNYDSFTYNLVQYLAELGAEVAVFRNDAIDVDGIATLAPEGILLSPGPGRPEDGGITLACVERFAGQLPLLGVCLGHQSMAQAFGARIVRADRLMHGRTSSVHHRGDGLFEGLANPFTATRYHSLIVERDSLPDCLEVTAWTDQEEIMGLAHREHPGFVSVQFHPESFLTDSGHALLERFLSLLPDHGQRPQRAAS